MPAAFNVYPRIVELQQVIESDVMRGALLSVLGKDYAMSAHRSLRFATGGDQTTHKDSTSSCCHLPTFQKLTTAAAPCSPALAGASASLANGVRLLYPSRLHARDGRYVKL